MKKEIIYNYKEFVKCYSELLQKFLLIDPDYEELDFLKLELENYKTYYANTITQYFSEREYFDVDNNFFVVNNEAYQIVSEISDYANKYTNTYEDEGYDLLAFKFKKIIEFLEQKKYSIESKSPPRISDFLYDKKEILKLETEIPPTETAPGIDLRNKSQNENIYLGQPTNDKADDFFDFLCEYYRPEESTQIKYVNILYYLKNDASKEHFIFKLSQKKYKELVIKKGIIISKFDKSANYKNVEKPIFFKLENTFLKNMTV